MKKSLLIVIASLLLSPIDGSAQNWLKKLEKAAKEIEKVLDTPKPSTDSANTPSGETTNSTSDGNPKGGLKIVTNHPDLVIKIKRCKASGNTCVIDFVVTNAGEKDINAEFYSGYYDISTAFDDEGNEYGKDVFLIGKANGELAGKYSHDTRRRVLLPSNVPLKMRIQIESISESATEFARINLGCYSNEFGLSHDKPIIISHVPISRDGDE